MGKGLLNVVLEDNDRKSEHWGPNPTMITPRQRIITKVIPRASFIVILRGSCDPQILGKEGQSRRITREIRNFRTNNYFRDVVSK